MFTQIMTATNDPVILNFPKEILGHKVKVTFDDLGADEEKQRKKNWEEALAFWNSQQVDMSNFKFNRDEANER